MKQIKIHGLGGQGVVTAAKLFAEAVAIGEKKHAQAIPAYGHERRGAPVYADVIMSELPIKLKSFVFHLNVVVIFDLAVLDKGVDVMAYTDADTIFILNAKDMGANVPFIKHKIYFVDALKISLETIKRDIPNAAMLGAMAGAGLVGLESISSVVVNFFGKAGASNGRSCEEGYRQLRAR